MVYYKNDLRNDLWNSCMEEALYIRLLVRKKGGLYREIN
jgi:hypothetical protein